MRRLTAGPAAAFLWSALVLFGCHGTDRSNPLDPELTPPVDDLAAAASDSLGAVLLSWTAYAGPMPFAAYLVLRKEQGLEKVDTLAILAAPRTTSFRDTTALPDRDYEYRVLVRNRDGFDALGSPTPVRSYQVTGVRRLAVTPDGRRGAMDLSWEPYSGPGFGGYEIWREGFDLEARRLVRLGNRFAASWTDTAVVPDVVYQYRLRTQVFDVDLDIESQPVSFALTPPAITRLELDWRCACARLQWSPYGGPGFAGYQVVRRAVGVADSVVAHLAEPTSTALVDSLLEGNTEYFFRVEVRTPWDGVVAASPERSGSFYTRSGERTLGAESDTEVRAIDLAVDAAGGVWAVATMISTTTARLMRPGLRLHGPDRTLGARFTGLVPSGLSPVRIAVAAGRVYVAVRDTAGQLRVAAMTADGVEAWLTTVGSGRPVGVYLVDGDLVVVDDEAMLHRLDPDTGDRGQVDDRLNVVLEGSEGLPLQDLSYATDEDLDEIYLLVPQNSRHKVISKLWLGAIFGGGSGFFFDNGVGPGPGQFLDPLAIAYDASSQRLVVMESRGLLQVLDASVEGQDDHYVTRWGAFGRGPGEFLVTPSTAVDVVVDAQSRVHVADAATAGGRIQTFVP